MENLRSYFLKENKMAISKTVMTPHGIEVQNAYHRVEGLTLQSKNKLKFQVRASVDGTNLILMTLLTNVNTTFKATILFVKPINISKPCQILLAQLTAKRKYHGSRKSYLCRSD